MRYLTTSEIQKYYDAWGLKQDDPGPYESLALDELAKHGQWQQANNVFELGPGTGKFALALLENQLPDDANYSAWELSDTMLSICRQRLQSFNERVSLQKSNGELPSLSCTYDRVVANFVLDIFSPKQIDAFFDFAYTNLQVNGLLCLSNLSFGQNISTKIMISLWQIGYFFKPNKFGGCRPLALLNRKDKRWQQIHASTIEPKWGVPSEVLILKKR